MTKTDFTIGGGIEEITYDIAMTTATVRRGNVLAHVRPADDLSQYEQYPRARVQMVGGRHSGLIVRWDDSGVEEFVSDGAWLDGDYPAVRPALGLSAGGLCPVMG